jgi:class 3 adenylate cyclase
VALVLGLLIALAAALLAIAELTAALVRTRRELAMTRESLRSTQAPRALHVAERAVRNVVDSAAQVRKYGVTEFLMSSIQDFTRWTAEDQARIATTAAPDGTVTILFTDIQDSTALNEQLGDSDWVRVLDAHDRVVRTRVERHDGHVVKSQGDGFMVVFGEAIDGVRAALAIQAALARGGSRRLRRTPIHVRIGMHVGEVTSREGDYFGRNVALAARVAACADGGQILVTDAVRDSLGDDADTMLRAADEVELKGLAGRHQLWRVVDR